MAIHAANCDGIWRMHVADVGVAADTGGTLAYFILLGLPIEIDMEQIVGNWVRVVSSDAKIFRRSPGILAVSDRHARRMELSIGLQCGRCNLRKANCRMG